VSELTVRLVDPPAYAAALRRLVEDRVASRIAERDATTWGPGAEDEASRRLGWVDLPRASRSLLPVLAELAQAARRDGLDHVVLCGMGGSSLAPEVIAATAGVPLTVLDTTDPQVVRRALADRLEATILVVSSKSGGTVETDSQRRAYVEAFRAAGIDPATRVVVVTDPGSPFEQLARDEGYRAVVLADPEVGGRYSALSAFGLVPSTLAGVDVEQLLAEAESVLDALAQDSADNPALLLGAALGASHRDKVAIADDRSGLSGFADWAEQLIAESTGKEGRGVLPVAVEDMTALEIQEPPADVLPAVLTRLGSDDAPPAAQVTVCGPLGAQMQLWEHATAVAGVLLGINPFDQPDVESAKTAARGLLDARPAPEDPAFVEEAVEVRATTGLLDGVTTLRDAVDALLHHLGPRGYLAVMAYLDREADGELAGVRRTLARRVRRPVTFGWGPRFLHSTGQYHKGGPPQGVFLQVTGAVTEDLAVPGRPYSFGELLAAQAGGDATVLADHDRPVLRLHLRDRVAGVALLREVLA
jgi:glucose-6-phosphate isomerase